MKGKLKLYNLVNNLRKGKYKLKKKFYKLTVTALLITSLSACGNSKTTNNSDEYSYKEEIDKEIESFLSSNNYSSGYNGYNEEKKSSNISMQVEEEKTYEQDYLNSIIDMQVAIDSDYANYVYEKIDNTKVDYRYSELFEIDSALQKYNALSQSNNLTEPVSSNFSLYDVVKQNNNEFLKTYTGNSYKELSDSNLKKVCQSLMESINYELESNLIETGNIEEKLKTLRILNYNEFSYAFYDQNKDILGVSLNAIETIDKEDAFNRIIYHEAKHIIQANCNNESDSVSRQYGISYKWDDLKVNSLFNEWFYETSAEQLTLNQTKRTDSIVYENGLRCFSVIKSATLVNDENSIEDLEKLSLQSDINELYEYFNCNNELEQKEILEMMFAYNILISTTSETSTEEFYKNYQEKYGKKMTIPEKTYYGYELSGNICTSLTKIFYRDLLEKVESSHVSLKDIFSLITIFETELNKQCRYYENTKADYLESFFESYINIQDTFFEAIADSMNLTVDEIKKAYNTHFKGYNFSNIDLLNQEKNDFYSDIYAGDNNFRNDTVGNYYQLYYGKTHINTR